MENEAKFSRRVVLASLAVSGGNLLSLIERFSPRSYAQESSDKNSPTLRIGIPMYHNFNNPAMLANDMQVVLDHGWQLTTPRELEDIFSGVQPHPEVPIFLPTLDDGFKSQVEALRIAHERFSGQVNWGAVWSPVMCFDRLYDLYGVPFNEMPGDTPCFRVGQPDGASVYIAWQYASKDEVTQTLFLNENISLGVHGLTHTNLALKNEAELREEIGGSLNLGREFYRSVGRTWNGIPIAYPLGGQSNLVKNISHELGCTLGFLKSSTASDNAGKSMLGFACENSTSDPYAIPRMGRT